VVGGGPAGLTAASAAAAAGARTVVLERAEHPRYKTCGGGLLGVSRAAAAGQITVPVRDEIRSVTFTLRGGQEFTRSHGEPVLTMVTREEFDAALLDRARSSGAVVRQRAQVRAIEQADGRATARLADGTAVTATVIIGADGASGVTARHVGAAFGQVDLGLELEIAVPEATAQRWAGRVLLDWGKIPGSYAWVFPKGDRLTVGVIAARGQGEATKAYLREFVARLGLAHREVLRDSGHLTHCRADGSPLRRGQVIVAGDAAGLLEPWTREGISYALRSAAAAGDPAATTSALDAYAAAVSAAMVPDIHAGRMLLSAFTRHAGAVHKVMSTAMGWRAFVKTCRSELTLAELVISPAARIPLSLLNRF
jgi:geranylgeranyl reductase family protein